MIIDIQLTNYHELRVQSIFRKQILPHSIQGLFGKQFRIFLHVLINSQVGRHQSKLVIVDQ